MDRLDFYFQQLVLESDLDTGFDQAEQADWFMFEDMSFYGVLAGFAVVEDSPPSLEVTASGPGRSYDKDGKRLAITSDQQVDVSEDSGGTPTTVATSGYEKWVSVFLRYDRDLSNPKTDGGGATVYYNRNEAVEFYVAQGAEAPNGTGTRPSLRSDGILIADIRRLYGVTTITNAEIYTDRTEYLLTQDDSGGSGVDVHGKYLTEALDYLAGVAAAHIEGTDWEHQATDIDFVPTEWWHNGTPLSATNVDGAIDEIVATLAEDAGGNPSGTDRIGSRVTTGVLADGSPLAAGAAWDQMNSLVSQLGLKGTPDGGTIVGAKAVAGSPDSLTQGSVASQLTQVLGYLNTRLKTTGGTMTGDLTMAANILADAVARVIGSTTYPFDAHFRRAWLGEQYTTTGAGARTPRLQSDMVQVATSRRTLLWELPNLAGAGWASVRIYAVNYVLIDSADQDLLEGIEIAVNCIWNGSAWEEDDGTLDFASKFMFSLDRLTIRKKAGTATPWSDSAWDGGSNPLLTLRAVSGRMTLNGYHQVLGAAPSGDPLPNTLYRNNVLKAWGSISLNGGSITAYSGFNLDGTALTNPNTTPYLDIPFKIPMTNVVYQCWATCLTGVGRRYDAHTRTVDGFTTDYMNVSTGGAVNHSAAGIHYMGFAAYGLQS